MSDLLQSGLRETALRQPGTVRPSRKRTRPYFFFTTFFTVVGGATFFSLAQHSNRFHTNEQTIRSEVTSLFAMILPSTPARSRLVFGRSPRDTVPKACEKSE